MKLLLVIAASLVCAPAQAMIGNAHAAYHNGTCSATTLPHALTGRTEIPFSSELIETEEDDITALPLPIRIAVVHDEILKAVERGDAQQVESYFSGWRTWVMPWEYYRKAVADTLLHAAQLPHETSGPIVEKLLTRLKADDIEQNPDAYIKAAVKNNHPAIIKYMQNLQKFGQKYTAAVLIQSILESNQKEVNMLLNAGVNPLTSWATGQNSVVLQIALHMIATPKNDQAPLDTRLAIFDSLLAHADPAEMLTAFDIDLSGVPHNIRRALVARMAASMFHGAFVNDKTVTHAESPLHKAAREKDYSKCFAYLTKWSGPLNKQEMLPLDALLVLNFAHNDQKAQQKAAKEFSQFPVSFQKLMEARLKISKDQLLAQDSQGRTPHQVAQAHGASQELIELLDPKNHQNVPLVLISSDIKKVAGKRVIIPTDAQRIPVLDKLDPQNDQASIEAVTSTHATLMGALKQYEASPSKEIKKQLMKTHAEFLELLDKLESSDDRGVSDTIMLDLKRRTNLEKTNLKVTLSPKPVDNPTGPAHKLGDFFIENGAIYKVESVEKAK